jgi:hypothetical protein
MRRMQIRLTPTPDDDIAAAVIAAIAFQIEQAPVDEGPETPARMAWQAAAKFATQGLPPARNGAHASWHAAERARRADRWSYGIVGI